MSTQPREVLQERILARNKSLGSYEFYLPDNELKKIFDDWFNLFQIPTAEELNSYDFLG
ncbi:MAG TPA: hypothetical protein PKY59_11620 [Pyrinomonadaceae bacterium]|nr:hypothetical protein [Pyrinomonadaceae bacterium]